MAWFVLARVVFAAIVAYAAAVLRPLPFGIAANVAFALALAALVAFFETKLRAEAVTRVIGAVLGVCVGLGVARAFSAGLASRTWTMARWSSWTMRAR